MSRIRVVLALALLAGCVDSTAAFTGVVNGTWGGDDAGLIAIDSTAHVHIGCTLGDAKGPITADANGHFDVTGTYNVNAYPISMGPLHPARFTGQINGRDMVLTVSLMDTMRVLGPVTLTYGRQPAMGPCPICRTPKQIRALR